MNTYIVCDKIINRIVTWLAGRDQLPERAGLIDAAGIPDNELEFPRQLGAAMLELNCASFEALYGQGSALDFRPLDYEFFPESVSETHVLKSLQSWLDRCGHGGAAESKLYRLIQAAEDKLAWKIVTSSNADAATEWKQALLAQSFLSEMAQQKRLGLQSESD